MLVSVQAVELHPPTHTIEEIAAYRRKHGVTLGEAVRALGAKPYRTERPVKRGDLVVRVPEGRP